MYFRVANFLLAVCDEWWIKIHWILDLQKTVGFRQHSDSNSNSNTSLVCTDWHADITDNNQVRASLPPDKPKCFTTIQWNAEISECINHLVDVNEAYTASRSTVHNSHEQLLPETADYIKQNTRTKFREHGFSDSGPAAWNGLPPHLRTITDSDGDGLSRRDDGSLVTDDEDEFGSVSRDQSEKHKCGHTWRK